jgi:outer membrane biosynthesis protein TonB
MRVATAFFAGVGTVVVAIGAGLGGGLLLGDIMSPQQPKHPSSEVTRLEQRSSPQQIPATNGASQPVPYMAAPQVAATVGEASAQPQQQPQQQQPQQTQQQQPQQVQPQVQQASAQSEPKPQPERNAPAQSAVAVPPPAANAEPSAARAAPDDSFAKAREVDVKRDGRRADDRRRADRRQLDERRQQWVDKRKGRQHGDDDLGDVEASVREATEPRSLFGREQRYERREPSFESRGPSFGSGRFNLFDD